MSSLAKLAVGAAGIATVTATTHEEYNTKFMDRGSSYTGSHFDESSLNGIDYSPLSDIHGTGIPLYAFDGYRGVVLMAPLNGEFTYLQTLNTTDHGDIGDIQITSSAGGEMGPEKLVFWSKNSRLRRDRDYVDDDAPFGDLDHQNYQGYAYVYTGEWTRWSMLQHFHPEYPYNDGTDYSWADSIGADDVNNGRTFVIGCPNCNEANVQDDDDHTGSIFVYENPPAGDDVWKLTHIIRSETTQYLHIGMEETQVSGPNIATFAYNCDNTPWCILPYRKEGPNWNEKNEISYSYNPESFSMWGDQMMVGYPTADHNDGCCSGGVVYYEYDQPKKEWTMQQLLLPTDTSENFHFGYDVEMMDNTALVTFGEDNCEDVYVFKRGSRHSPWSLQQVINGMQVHGKVALYGSSFFFNSNCDVVDDDNPGRRLEEDSLVEAAIMTGADAMEINMDSLTPLQRHSATNDLRFEHDMKRMRSAYNEQLMDSGLSRQDIENRRLDGSVCHSTRLYTEDEFWNGGQDGCLSIGLADTFGDGWDKARLRINAPSHTEFYAPTCDTSGWLSFRYCPMYMDDSGLYKLEIINHIESHFAWEINWVVRINSGPDAGLYYGDAVSTMDFAWGGSNRPYFEAKHMHEVSDGNAVAAETCSNCKQKPKPKPGPQQSNYYSLYGEDDWTYSCSTNSFLYSGSNQYATPWQLFVMSGPSWYSVGFEGMEYLISDVAGHKLLQHGSSCCAGEPCWVELKDGKYSVRVTGQLRDVSWNAEILDDDGVRSAQSWSFCGATGYDMEHLVIVVQNQVCSVESRTVLQDYCEDNLDIHTVIGNYEKDGIYDNQDDDFAGASFYDINLGASEYSNGKHGILTVGGSLSAIFALIAVFALLVTYNINRKRNSNTNTETRSYGSSADSKSIYSAISNKDVGFVSSEDAAGLDDTMNSGY